MVEVSEETGKPAAEEEVEATELVPGGGRGGADELDPDEVEKLFPSSSAPTRRGERVVFYEGLVGLLIEAVKELDSRVSGAGAAGAGLSAAPIAEYDRPVAEAAAESLPSYSLPAERVAEIALPPSWPVRGHAGVGLGRLDRGRGAASASSTAGSRPATRGSARSSARSPSRPTRRASRGWSTTTRATSSATAPPAPGSSARWRPSASSSSVRVLGPDNRGSGALMLAGLHWAIERGPRGDQHEPLDHRSRTCSALLTQPHRRRLLPGARRSSPPPTTWRSRATRGASPR